MKVTQDTLTWVFKDPEWKNKFIIGSALFLAASFFGIVGFIGLFPVYGYSLAVMRAAIRGESRLLPKCDRLGELFVDGLKGTLAAILYFLPGILALVVAAILLFGALFGGIFSAAATGSRATPAQIGLYLILGQVGFFVLLPLSLVLFLVGSIPATMAWPQYARTGQIGAGYRVREMWRIFRANVAGFALAFIITAGLGVLVNYVISFMYLTIIFCFIAPLAIAPISFYLLLISTDVLGAAYREAAAKIPELEMSAE